MAVSSDGRRCTWKYSWYYLWYNFAVSHGTIAIARGCQRVRVISYAGPMQAQSVSCGGPRRAWNKTRYWQRNFIKVQSSVQFSSIQDSGVHELHVLPPHSSCYSVQADALLQLHFKVQFRWGDKYNGIFRVALEQVTAWANFLLANYSAVSDTKMKISMITTVFSDCLQPGKELCS